MDFNGLRLDCFYVTCVYQQVSIAAWWSVVVGTITKKVINIILLLEEFQVY